MKPAVRNSITIVAIALSAIILLDVLKAPDALLRFFAAGHIPGTGIYIDAGIMLSFWMILAGIITGRLTVLFARAIVRLSDKYLRHQNA